MKNRVWVGLLLLAFSVTAFGCAKKSSEQTSISTTGFDSGTAAPITTTEELSQLPVASTTTQSGSLEALPIENSPVSQAVSAGATELEGAIATKALSHDQEIQTALKNLGLYNGKIDGKLGPASKQAIIEFQTQNNLKADGKVGPKTWALLSAHLGGAAMQAASAGLTTDVSAANS